MGNVGRLMRKPLRDFNVENRAHKIISRDKPIPAPKYKSDELELEKVLKENPKLVEEMSKKNTALDKHLKEVYVSSTDVTPIDGLTSHPTTLPLSRRPVNHNAFGMEEPEVIPDGRVTLRLAMEFINGHYLEPEKFTSLYIAAKYKLNHQTVCDILEYYKTFEVFIPKDQVKMKFARPSGYKEIE